MTLSIAEIKRSLDIIEVIGAEVELRQRGSNFWGLCPFHAEKTPSFCVFPDTQKFHCFGGGEHGDAIDFVQKYHGINFKEALAFLGIEQQKVTPDIKADIQQRQRRRVLVERFRQWEVHKSDEVGTILRNCRRLLGRIRTVDDLDKYGDLFHLIPGLEYKLDILCSKNDKLKFNLYKEGLLQ